MLKKSLEIHGHRGARGLYPENTLTGFKEAIKIGVTALEMDVVVSADNEIVVSHEAWMNEQICSMPNGELIKAGEGKKYNLYKMTYAEIEKFDCGKKGHPEFPFQNKIAEYKPLLNTVLQETERFVIENRLSEISYTIEIKSEEAFDTVFNPTPEQFVKLVLDVLKTNKILNRTTLQSFDVRILQVLHEINSGARLALLVENTESLENNLNRLGFKPDVYSPEYILVNKDLNDKLKAMGIKLIPWTVNESDDIKKMLSFDVAGIISDYPDRVIEILKK